MVAVAAKVPVTAPCNAKAASLVIAVLPAAVRITFASASKVSKVIPAVATSFKVTLPVADKLELSVIPPVVAVAAKVPVTAPCNAKAASLVIAVSPAAVRITFASASKVSKVIPAVATSFKVKSPVTAIVALSVIPPAVAVTARVPPTVLSVPPSRNKSPSAEAALSKSIAPLSTKTMFPKV